MGMHQEKCLSQKEIAEIVGNLKASYRKALLNAYFDGGQKNLRGLAQIIIGPARSGKTTEARDYATALVEAGLADDKPPVEIDGGIMRSHEEFVAMFTSAEKGVIIIDDIDKQPAGTGAAVLSDLMIQSFDTPRHILILTGNEEGMKAFIAQCRPELRARMPKIVQTDKTFTPEEVDIHHQKIAEARRLRAQKEELQRCIREWHELAGDVTLKKAVSPMKTLTLLRKNDTVA